ncbi:hypothetical protein ALI144C_13245 [Actinosynnema sp. ALI-1.44]|uniref:hypothetical protein n=1 Tax=Actinosynnema sp. ALI-1.44 TaxID=1933779 RepID=UPI00097CA605|nr:hypothetical protein [Actinosynnema sp. ALI-1.44]ONI85270.1 hypothetical protein ALI144C_13245 [Actinosynnema sp. ALI-1.44]
MQGPYGQDLSRRTLLTGGVALGVGLAMGSASAAAGERAVVVTGKTAVLGGAGRIGLDHLRDLDTVADVSVTRQDHRWWMVLGATTADSPVIGLYSARLPRGAAPDSPGWMIDTFPGDPTVAAPLAPVPPPDAWDATGYHCPVHVRARGVRRIYYASTPKQTLYGPYRIGCLQWMDGRWHRRPEPVFTAVLPWERSTVLEPNVVHAGGLWRIFYAAGLTATDDAVIGYAESRDGLTGWRHRRLDLATGEFDAAVTPAVGGGYHRVTARHPAHRPLQPSDGLWWSATAGLDNPQWTPPVQLVRSDDGTAWHQGGVWKPSVVTDSTRPGHGHVFFNGVAFDGGRPEFTVGRISYRRQSGEPAVR